MILHKHTMNGHCSLHSCSYVQSFAIFRYKLQHAIVLATVSGNMELLLAMHFAAVQSLDIQYIYTCIVISCTRTNDIKWLLLHAVQ